MKRLPHKTFTTMQPIFKYQPAKNSYFSQTLVKPLEAYPAAAIVIVSTCPYISSDQSHRMSHARHCDHSLDFPKPRAHWEAMRTSIVHVVLCFSQELFCLWSVSGYSKYTRRKRLTLRVIRRLVSGSGRVVAEIQVERTAMTVTREATEDCIVQGWESMTR